MFRCLRCLAHERIAAMPTVVNGLLKNIQQVLFMINEETIIVPGHGAMANKADLFQIIDVICELRDKVAMLIKQ